MLVCYLFALKRAERARPEIAEGLPFPDNFFTFDYEIIYQRRFSVLISVLSALTTFSRRFFADYYADTSLKLYFAIQDSLTFAGTCKIYEKSKKVPDTNF
ncbi:MAG: hypothetical protein A3G49_01260 [Candidatus Sungbacteria bacterium RIFCSPLOWO2_12_FULL_41_11]|uniref:Uncharacterized protein n=1 Tax=Candidatus Sungbacteria bacterium RIFCSPLOWO2_12_FULL_41_11 TaxID=1802286 RepID=A0A1G2LQY8_9BACT|nr:MAG: hypothetical protein A3D41_05445 [Candidatus Sungbacteria bacterium RIFCSPHIGHO2_02_FULL_41_12b]OHA13262.1 MAG: hypothetical protein A3G49_01260 [Candidatus Sungbacteria bacterium RIFCSPLOWO2_12_FULL_41_11]